MKGKVILVVLAFLLLAGTLYAGRINSDDVEIRRMYPNGTISNCGANGPSEVDFEIWIINPVGEKVEATFYYKDLITGEWEELAKCNISSYGSTCGDNEDISALFSFGGQGNGTEDEMEVLKFTFMHEGEEYYHIIEMDVGHRPSSTETLVLSKIGQFSTQYEGFEGGDFCTADGTACCPITSEVASLAGKGETATTFVEECKISNAKTTIEDALDSLDGLDAEGCEAAIAKIDGVQAVYNERGCNSARVESDIQALKDQLESGDYDINLGAVNTAMEYECGGALPSELPTVDGGDDGDLFSAPPPPSDEKKLCCVSLFVLLAVPLVARWVC